MTARRRTAFDRRARAALLWAGGIFALVQLAGGVILDYAWTAVRFPSCALVLDELQTTSRRPDIVCLGSSRFMAGLPEETLGRLVQKQLHAPQPLEVLNAAVPSGDHISSDYMLRQLLRRGVRPRLALIEVSPESLNRYNTWLNIHVQRQLRWEDLPRYFVDICKAQQFQRLLKARFIPLVVHHRQIVRTVGNGIMAMWPLSIGHRTEQPAEAVDPVRKPNVVLEDLARRNQVGDTVAANSTLREVDQVYRWLKNYKIGGTAAASLERVIRRCQQNGIEVILVGVPVSSAHRQAYTPAIDEAFLHHVQHVANTYHCQFVDCRARVPDRLFMDHHHLLPEGGRFFSELLAREVLAPAWRRE